MTYTRCWVKSSTLWCATNWSRMKLLLSGSSSNRSSSPVSSLFCIHQNVTITRLISLWISCTQVSNEPWNNYQKYHCIKNNNKKGNLEKSTLDNNVSAMSKKLLKTIYTYKKVLSVGLFYKGIYFPFIFHVYMQLNFIILTSLPKKCH